MCVKSIPLRSQSTEEDIPYAELLDSSDDIPLAEPVDETDVFLRHPSI